MSGQLRDWDFALLIIVLCVAMFLSEIIGGIRKYRRARDLARQISQEHVAREFLDQDWRRRHGS
jgi:cell division protein FtsL